LFESSLLYYTTPDTKHRRIKHNLTNKQTTYATRIKRARDKMGDIFNLAKV